MVKTPIRMLASDISHMALNFVWRDSGVTQGHGFDLQLDVAGVEIPGQAPVGMRDRAPRLLDGTYDFLSGLHHETYQYRARGDKRFVYLAQAQNDWDDRVVATAAVRAPRDLEGQTVLCSTSAPCVMGNLKHALELAGVDLGRVRFETARIKAADVCAQAVEAVLRGEAAAASVDIPFDLRGERRGLHVLKVPSVPVIHNATMCANRDWVQQNEETTLAFLRSMVEAIHFFKTQPDRVCQILERTLAPLVGIETEDEIRHLQRAWAALLSPKPYPHPLAVWNVYNLDVAHNPEFNFVGPFEVWDTSYLRAIDDEGFIDGLYGDARQAVNPAVNAAI
jgi:hypothetical protein